MNFISFLKKQSLDGPFYSLFSMKFMFCFKWIRFKWLFLGGNVPLNRMTSYTQNLKWIQCFSDFLNPVCVTWE